VLCLRPPVSLVIGHGLLALTGYPLLVFTIFKLDAVAPKSVYRLLIVAQATGPEDQDKTDCQCHDACDRTNENRMRPRHIPREESQRSNHRFRGEIRNTANRKGQNAQNNQD
jgi:hypothetical protein